MNNNVSNITAGKLREAAAIKDQIDRLEAELAAILSGGAAPAVGKRRGRKPGAKNKPKDGTAAPTSKKKAKRKMSAEGRARIGAAQKARWAKIKKGK
jgi:hypothetical protein